MAGRILQEAGIFGKKPPKPAPGKEKPIAELPFLVKPAHSQKGSWTIYGVQKWTTKPPPKGYLKGFTQSDVNRVCKLADQDQWWPPATAKDGTGVFLEKAGPIGAPELGHNYQRCRAKWPVGAHPKAQAYVDLWGRKMVHHGTEWIVADPNKMAKAIAPKGLDKVRVRAVAKPFTDADGRPIAWSGTSRGWVHLEAVPEVEKPDVLGKTGTGLLIAAAVAVIGWLVLRDRS